MRFLLTLLFTLLVGCGTTDSTLQNQGKSPAYIQGFHDGRHSGMSEQGNTWEHYIRDESSFKNDVNYRSGWLAGENEGKRLQAQASAIGNAAAGSYQPQQPDFDKIAKDTVKDIDTSDLKNLK